MVIHLSRLALFVLMLPQLTRSEWVPVNRSAAPYTPPTVTLLQDDGSSSVLRIDLAGFEVSEFTSDGKTYHAIDLMSDMFSSEVGYPEVPGIARILAVPDRLGVSVQVIEAGEVQSFTGYMLPPVRPSWEEGNPEPPYLRKDNAYQSGSAYPPHYATVDPPAIVRDFRVVRVAVYPVRYVAEKQEIQVLSSITVRVTYGAGEAVNPKTTPKRPIAPSFAALYRNIIFNYQSILDRDYNGMESGRDVMLCIMPDASVASFRPYAEWKHRSGIYIRQTKFSDIGANATNPDIIKNHITQAYRTWEYPPTYVLLVGDHGQFPIKNITAGGYTFANEDFFVEIDGNDYFPEMMIGRFTHDNDYGLQVLVNKSMNYERLPYTTNTDWFKKGIVVSNNAYASQMATKRFVRSVLLEDGGFAAVDTFMNNNPCYSDKSMLISTINNGRSFLNYRGEGWFTEWWASCYRMGVNDVSSINNGRMLTFVTSIGCGVANFANSSGNSYGEAWLELGTPTAPRGACAFIGPTSNSHTQYNNKIDKGIYIGMFREEGIETAAQALLRGKFYMYQIHGNHPWVDYHYRVYTTLGDPSIHIWKGVPRAIRVNHPAVLPIGYNQVTVTVTDSATGLPLVHAEVYITGDSVFAGGWTDALGRITVGITAPLLDTLSIVVHGERNAPYEGEIRLAPEPEHVGPVFEPPVIELSGNGDGKINPNETHQMTVTLKNWGTQTASNVQAVLTVPDTNMVRVLTTDPVSFGNLASGGSYTGSAFQFYVKPTCPVGYIIPFILRVNSMTRSWTYTHNREVKGCVLQFKGWVVDDLGSSQRNYRIDPGETVKLSLKIANTGEDVAPNVMGVLRTSDPHVIILDSVGTYGVIQKDSLRLNTADYFVVSVPDTSLVQHYAPSSIMLYTQGGNYPYSVVDTFSLPIGVPFQSDPTGPDAYGYYAYSSDDLLFVQAPRYNWFDISTIGTRIPGNNTSEFTVTVSLPFSFKYYGVNYSQVRISSDGWIAFGSGTQTAYENFPLPRNDAINCMVAPFWDDLFADGSGDISRLHYYVGPGSDKFTIQWTNAGHYVDTTRRETFQVVLLNSSEYPTPTGDGEIIFQYKKVAEAGGNTVGIEDHTQTRGMTYLVDDQYHPTATSLIDSFAIKFTTQRPQFVVGVKEDGRYGSIPMEYRLEQNYPNPFNPVTTISYSLPLASPVSLKIYNVTGQLVRTVFSGVQKGGQYSIRWDGTNDMGTAVGTGVYFYRLQAGPFIQTKKLLLIK